MNRSTLDLLAIGLFFTLTSEKCEKAAQANTGDQPSVDVSTIPGAQWSLATIAGEAIRLPEGATDPFISFDTVGNLTGFGGCNKLMGSVKLDGASLSFPGLGSTKKFCDGTQDLESSFMSALRATNSYKLKGNTLTLLDKSKELATLVKQ